MRIVQISDLHLSPKHGFFINNWRRAARRLQQMAPDLVIVTGDLAINGPDDAGELAFARAELDKLGLPWRALPGNHDIGDEPPGQDPTQLVNAARLDAWRTHFGADWWSQDVPGWRLIGLDSQVFGSGLPDEAAQWDFLRDALDGATGDIGVFMHKPLTIDDPDEPASTRCIVPAPRKALTELFDAYPVRFLATGHLHAAKHQSAAESGHGFDRIWAPPLAFVLTKPTAQNADHILPGTRREVGMVVYDLQESGWNAGFDAVADAEVFDLDDIKQGRYAFLRDMPAYFPEDLVELAE